MTSLRLALLLLTLSVSSAQATISSLMEWDVRTTGNDTNGGAFKRGATGTDYSQQDAVQVSYVDLVVGATTTQVTSVLHPFSTGVAVGNIINITAGTGCTTGRFEVTSVNTGTSTATLDRSAGTAASACTAVLGGSLATVGAAATAMISGNAIHIQSGTYTITTGIVTPGGNGYFEGFAVTHNDGGTRPLITTATNSTKLWDVCHSSGGAATTTFYNISFSNTASVRAIGLHNFNTLNYLVINNCIFDGFTIAISADGDEGFSTVGQVSATNTEFKNGAQAINADANFSADDGNILCFGCYVHAMTSASGALRTFNGGSLTLIYSVLAANNVAADNFNEGVILNSDIVSNTGTQAVRTVRETIVSKNSIYYGNTGTALVVNNATVTAGVPTGATLTKNAFGANGANYVGVTSISEITLTASPFTSSTNFTLNAAAGGGALLKKTGAVVNITGSTTTATLDVGAIQTAAGGGAVGSAFTQ